jgi:uncharacterized protein (TIGR04255 family)
VLFACEFDAAPSEDSLSGFAASEAGAYSVSDRLRNLQAGFMIVGDGPPQSQVQDSFAGFLRRDDSAQRAFQARVDGLLVAKIRPYSRWEDVEAETRRLWISYQQHLSPKQLSSLRVRYINQFDLPLPVPRLDRYFRTLPVVAAELPQQLSAYAFQLNLPQTDSPNTLVVVRQATIQPARPGVLSVVFDVEVARSVSMKPNDEQAWAELADLHTRENQVFEASITDATRELIS